MTDYASWPEDKLSIASLLLDPKNPRIPPTGSELGQRELIEELVLHDHVYDLARDIISEGWSPLEFMIALEDADGTLILEGNRRLCALKLIADPSLAPKDWEKKFKNISALPGAAAAPRTARVIIAPTREDAAPLIMQKHTRQQVENWDPLMKARFYRSLAQNGLTVDQLAKQYGGKASEIADMLRLDQMYSVACRLPLEKSIADIVKNPREFNATHLERILGFSDARKMLGVEWGENGEVLGNGNEGTFVNAYGKIISDIATGEVDSRFLNKADEAAEYVKKVVSSVPGATGKGGGKFKMDDVLTGKKANPAKGAAAKKAKSKPAPKPSPSVLPRGFKCEVPDLRVNKVFDELRRLNLESHANSSAVMLRILLELSVDRYLHKTGKLEQLTKALQAKNNKPKDWTPTLAQMLTALVADDTFRLHGQALRTLNKMISTGNPVVADLDGFVHNNYAWPTADTLRMHWEVLEPIMRVVMSDPKPPNTKADPHASSKPAEKK